MEKKKAAVLVYPFFSMQEISCLTAALSLYYGMEIDVYASSLAPVRTEDGFLVVPEKTLGQFHAQDYACLVLPGILNPLPALFDGAIIDFLHGLKHTDLLLAAISSAPILLARAGLLEGEGFTSGLFAEMCEYHDFIPEQNIRHELVVHSGNIITAVGFAFREFATEVINAMGLDSLEQPIFGCIERELTPGELVFHMGEEEFMEWRRAYHECERKA